MLTQVFKAALPASVTKAYPVSHLAKLSHFPAPYVGHIEPSVIAGLVPQFVPHLAQPLLFTEYKALHFVQTE